MLIKNKHVMKSMSQDQAGAVLVVSLVLLLVLTLMGVSSMSLTSSELKISSNQQARNNAYEAGLSMLENVKQNPLINWKWIPATPSVNVVFDTKTLTGSQYSGTADVVFVNYCKKLSAGMSLTIDSDQGDSSSMFARLVQEVRATGTAFNSSGDTLSTSSFVNGISTSVASCPYQTTKL